MREDVEALSELEQIGAASELEEGGAASELEDVDAASDVALIAVRREVAAPLLATYSSPAKSTSKRAMSDRVCLVILMGVSRVRRS